MALSSKENKVAHYFREKLEQLSCPYIKDVDESWIIELVFRPGEPRIRLLQWLFTRFDERLHDVLNPQCAPNDSKMDSRIQRLLFVASSLGLCCSEDADLIRGNVPSGRQMSFMEQLLEMVCVIDASDDPQARSMHSPGHVSSPHGIEEQFAADCAFIDTLAASNKTAFSDSLKLLPPDIMKHVHGEWTSQSFSDHTKVLLPDLSNLMDRAETLTKDLDRQKDILQKLQCTHTLPSTDHQLAAKVHCTLRLIFTELSQLVVGFSYCFENEMRAWCNKSAPKLTPLGPAFKRVTTLLDQFMKLLTSMDGIRSSYGNLVGPLTKQVGKLSQQNNLVKSSKSLEELKDFHECVEVLEESIMRMDNTFNSSLRSALTISTIKAD